MPEAMLLHVEPQLYVTDLEATIAVFRDRLGFALAFTSGEPAFYAQVVRDSVRINLRHIDRPLIPAVLAAREPDMICATIPVSDAAALFAELEGRGASIHQRLQASLWAAGHADFIVEGPDNHLILFVGPTP